MQGLKWSWLHVASGHIFFSNILTFLRVDRDSASINARCCEMRPTPKLCGFCISATFDQLTRTACTSAMKVNTASVLERYH